LAALTAVAAGCTARGTSLADCPQQFDPRSLTDEDLMTQLGRLPERGATTRFSVNRTIFERREWIESNYRGVIDVFAGEGWGVTKSHDELGKIAFQRAPDRMIVVEVSSRRHCPDPDRGTLLVLSPEGLRVPVRFVYPER
jgi:hypothetical protein